MANFLRQKDFNVYCTREPGGSSIGDQIRDVLHDVKNTEMSSRAEILLYSASRAGSTSICTWRSTPPNTPTSETPDTLARRGLTVSARSSSPIGKGGGVQGAGAEGGGGPQQ